MSVQVSYKKQMVFGMLLLLIVIISFEGILRVYDNYNPNCKMTNSDVFSSIDNELKRSICLDNDRLRWNNSPYLHLEPNQHYTTIDINDDADIEKAIREEADTVYHPVGTCKMGDDDMSVVSHDLKVHKMKGLRVVDASIMPTLVGGNTNAPTIMIGEKASDLIINEWRI